jgi:hypothetical protein
MPFRGFLPESAFGFGESSAFFCRSWVFFRFFRRVWITACGLRAALVALVQRPLVVVEASQRLGAFVRARPVGGGIEAR